MKKSIGIIAAVVLSASIYSQNYDPAHPHSNRTELDSTFAAGPEADAQSSLRYQAEGGYSDSAAKQGLTLTDEEAAQALRKSHDSDLADRNQLEGLADPDRALESVDTGKPDLVYEEWILITPEDVGSPGETESGSDRSVENGRDVPNRPDMEQDDYSSAFDRETGILNDERIYSGEEYSRDYVGAPGAAESGTSTSRSHHEDDCEVDKDQSRRGGGTAGDRDERLNAERESVGGPAGTEAGKHNSELDSSDRSRDSAVENRERHQINRDDSKVEPGRSQEVKPLKSSESRPAPPDL